MAAIARARPVAYKDAWSAMAENRGDQNEFMASYAPWRRFSLGAHLSFYHFDGSRRLDVRNPNNGGDPAFAFAVVNALVLRANFAAAQVNLYLTGGVGGRFESARKQPALYAAVESDAETRDLYASVRAETALARGLRAMVYARARLGVAPYRAAGEGLQSWLILQVDHHSWTHQFSATPLLRFLYRNILFELGASTRGEWNFNWAIEY